MSTATDDNVSYDRVSVKGAHVTNEDSRLNNIVEFWLISAPGEQTCQQTWDNLNRAATRVAPAYKFHLPDLKVGTLDQLVGLSEDLSRNDAYVESVVRKASQYLADVLNEEKDKLKENLLVNGMSLAQYVTHFQWDMAKYPIKQSLRGVSDIISKQVTQIDSDLKTKSQAYNTLRGNLQNMERKSTGSLLTRSLNEIVKKEDVVTDSEYLATLIVVVPLVLQKDWLVKYEKLSEMVVPRSSRLVTEDNENALYTVTVFQKIVEEFRVHCRENKFIVRDYQYSENEVETSRKELTRLTTEKKTQFGPLVRWLKVNFGEAFIAWMHIKALRVFVESVLRYGLPVNFQAMILAPHRKLQKKLRDVLNQLYSHLDGSTNGKLSKSDIVELPGLAMSSDAYYPYVFYKVCIDMVE